MPTPIPADRSSLASMTADELDTLAAALDTARTLVDDIRDERSPESHCGQWDHSGHHWTHYGRSRYCWGDGPFGDREAYGKCGAKWTHPSHDLGKYLPPCPGVLADPAVPQSGTT
ncbi:hypothetical protein [Streptomyces sp. NPDC046988]|uniref:hypothetical protein n=1 Tax=Streptomyces sp. NPDC046988 TaxID=3154922 RepID=UPI0033F9B64F